MNWYVKKTAMEDPSAHIDDATPPTAPQPHHLPLPPATDAPPHGMKLRPGRKKGKGINLWRPTRD